MDNEQHFIKSLFKSGREYLETKIDLVHLKIVDKAAGGISSIFSILIIALIGVLALSAFNIGVSLWLGAIMGETWYGFFAVGGFNTFVAIVFIALRKTWPRRIVNDIVINKMLSNDYEDK